MAIYGRINDTSSLKGLYNGNEISYQSIQLPSWLEEKDKKNFLRFYYMLRYGVEIGDNNILATQVYDEGKSKDIILYSGLSNENKTRAHTFCVGNNGSKYPVSQVSEDRKFEYGLGLRAYGTGEWGGTYANWYIDIYNGFHDILEYAKNLGFDAKCIILIHDYMSNGPYGDKEFSLECNSNMENTFYQVYSMTSLPDTRIDDDSHRMVFKSVNFLFNYNGEKQFIYKSINNTMINEGLGSWADWNSSKEKQLKENFIFSNADFNWDF